MDSEIKKSKGKVALACLLAVATAVFTPFAIFFELLSVRMVLMLPSIGYIFLKNYAGRKIANLSALLMLLVSALALDTRFLPVIFAMTIIPLLIMRAFEKYPFGERMQVSIIAFLIGAVVSVVLMFVCFDGNMIENYLGKLPELLRTVSEEDISGGLDMLSGFMGETITVEKFYLLFDESVNNLIALNKQNMAGLLLSGAVISAVLCTWLDGLLRLRRNPDDQTAYMPIYKWYLPSSATGGLLLIFAISLIMFYANHTYGAAAFITVYRIGVAAFCVQGFASVRRRARATRKKAFGIIMTLGYVLLALFGAAPYFALYGVASAVFGSGGVIKQRMDAKMNRNSDNDRDKHNNEDE